MSKFHELCTRVSKKLGIAIYILEDSQAKHYLDLENYPESQRESARALIVLQHDEKLLTEKLSRMLNRAFQLAGYRIKRTDQSEALRLVFTREKNGKSE